MAIAARAAADSVFKDFSFLALSDLHVTSDSPGRMYKLYDQIMTHVTNTENNTKAVLIVGDITDGSTEPEESSKQCTVLNDAGTRQLLLR